VDSLDFADFEVTANGNEDDEGIIDTAESSSSPATSPNAGEKTALFSHLYIKTIILPRQARDKHRETTQKRRRVFLQRRTIFSTAPISVCLPR
jgi:hypothetical protein